MSNRFILAGILVFVSHAAFAVEPMPRSIQAAFLYAHAAAAASPVRNLFMLNYAYYAGGFCRDQDCSAQNVLKEAQAARAKMGDDFEKYLLRQPAYENSIRSLQSSLAKGDLSTLAGQRSASQILQSRIFATCVDFTKVVLAKAIEFGFSPSDLKFYVLMNADGYKQMCPGGPNGQRPVAPRPVVHTLVAYRANGNWFTLNVEDPEAVPSFVGRTLPNRLSRSYQFTFPALVAYQQLVFAGSFEPKDFVNGYDFASLLGITAAGELENDPQKIACR